MKKLVIVGAQELTRQNAPWEDKSFDIWALTHHARAEWCKRFDAVIEIHEKSYYMLGDKDPQYFSWLKSIKKPVYMMEAHDDIKSAVLYPLNEIKEKYLSNIKVHGKPVENFFSSIDYTLALAVHQGYKQIDIYGVEMAHSSEYKNQQKSFTFWVAAAALSGVKVNLYCTEGLLDGPLYGKLTTAADRIDNYIDGMKQQKSNLSLEDAKLEGAIMFAEQLQQDARRNKE